MNDKKAIKYAKELMKFCIEQSSCQNCVFREYAGDHWNCLLNCIGYLDTITIESNYSAKREKGGYID